MKKLIVILLTAAIAAAGCGAAACSKGQTGGGNNTLSGYTRRSTTDGNFDCGCGSDCKCGGNCTDGCDCKQDCDCGNEDNGNLPEGQREREGRMPRGEHTGGMDGFEFDRGTSGKNPGEKHGKFGFFAPGDGFARRKPMPLPPPPRKDEGENDNNGNTEQPPAGETEEPAVGQNRRDRGNSDKDKPAKPGKKARMAS